MLQALCDLARQEELLGDDPNFEMKPVAWIVHLKANGKFLDYVPTHFTPPPPEGSKKKPKEEVLKLLVPRQPGRSGRKAPAYFMVDNAKYAFGTPTSDKDFPPEEGAEKSAWFRERVADCATETGDAIVKTVLKFLAGVAADGLPKPLPENCKSNDLFAFRVEPDFESLVHLRPAVRAYWQTQNQSADAEHTERQCLVTGAAMGEPGLVPLVKKLPGASTAGAAIVSFNAGAFESYGWKGSANASISKEAATQAMTSLNRLLDPAFKRPDGTVMRPRRLSLGGDTVVCYWARGAAGNDLCDHVNSLFDPEPADADQVGELYQSVWRGRAPGELDTSPFCAVTLSGAQGRVVVRDWYESTVAEVYDNLARHFADLSLVLNTRPAKDKQMPPAIALRTLLESLSPGGKPEGVPPQLAGEIFRAALSGSLYPYSILPRAIERMRAEIGREDWSDSYRRDARCSLIKAVLNRRFHLQRSTPLDSEILPTMDPTNKHRAYLLGRLLAVIERLQQGALGDVNASVIDRYFAAASATPRAVFPRLEKAVPHYVKKMGESENDKDAKFAPYLDRLRSTIMFHIDKPFPSFLPLDEQGLFMLGYHHQRHWIWLSKEKREAWLAERKIDKESVEVIL